MLLNKTKIKEYVREKTYLVIQTESTEFKWMFPFLLGADYIATVLQHLRRSYAVDRVSTIFYFFLIID